ncbi:hypothetical protein RHMOL_Rhmol01G0367200 [Rhododendron molle]|uniref:Uncharacterized protein n=1 Tax=Rhododendron molle TaxID=49168 RepID=A0ACC0Q9A6_RHOML|nr:hypothetical protein RHMOL_Rhmol01G0367200 [Rhododendron molle]
MSFTQTIIWVLCSLLSWFFFYGFSELFMTVTRLAVFYKQRDLYFYPAWSYAIPSTILKVLSTMVLLFAVHFVAISMFRFVASVCCTMVASVAVGSLLILSAFSFSGFVIPKASMPTWLKWGFWVFPLSYGEIGLVVNEFLAPRWQKDYLIDSKNQKIRIGAAIPYDNVVLRYIADTEFVKKYSTLYELGDVFEWDVADAFKTWIKAILPQRPRFIQPYCRSSKYLMLDVDLPIIDYVMVIAYLPISYRATRHAFRTAILVKVDILEKLKLTERLNCFYLQSGYKEITLVVRGAQWPMQYDGAYFYGQIWETFVAAYNLRAGRILILSPDIKLQ